MKKITYSVDEGAITIVGNYWESKNSSAVMLFHMMPAAKESWDTLAQALSSAGYGVLAIDLRGHGESTILIKGGKKITLDYKKFNDAEHQASERDVLGARAYLEECGIDPARIYAGGASIGANLALSYLASHSKCPAAFALSPGLKYRGVDITTAVSELALSQRVFIAAAEDDERVPTAVEEATALFDMISVDKVFKKYATGGHGTDLFAKHPELIDEIVGWLSKP